jgi:hypothetical protein
MNTSDERTVPGFLYGTEVARVNPMEQPGFELQLPLLEQEPEVKKKLAIALLVIFGVFLAGMIAGAILGIFI